MILKWNSRHLHSSPESLWAPSLARLPQEGWGDVQEPGAAGPPGRLLSCSKKKHKEKPTSEGNTELNSSRGVETMPDLVFHVWRPLQMYWNISLWSAWWRQRVAGLKRQGDWGDHLRVISLQDQTLKCKPLFRAEGGMQVFVFTEKDLRLGWSQFLDNFEPARD